MKEYSAYLRQFDPPERNFRSPGTGQSTYSLKSDIHIIFNRPATFPGFPGIGHRPQAMSFPL